MFGLGMNNNGTGLVLASMSLADHPRVMLPIIFYNLVQHLIAGFVDRLICRRPDNPDAGTVSASDRRRHVVPGASEWESNSEFDKLEFIFALRSA